MKRNREIRAAALEALKGRWGWAILVCIIYVAISCMGAIPNGMASGMRSASMLNGNHYIMPALAGISVTLSLVSAGLMIFAVAPLGVGFSNSFVRYYKKEGDNNQVIATMFSLGFAGGRYWRNVAGMLLAGVFIFLWTLLFIVPGIIKSYAYAMTPYILIDNPELGPNEARLKSIEMMRGYKGKLFGLDLSFIGWHLLCILSLGIGYIWLQPYLSTARAAFYQELLNAQKIEN
jgi:uncharacterized membrane protein